MKLKVCVPHGGLSLSLYAVLVRRSDEKRQGVGRYQVNGHGGGQERNGEESEPSPLFSDDMGPASPLRSTPFFAGEDHATRHLPKAHDGGFEKDDHTDLSPSLPQALRFAPFEALT